MGGLGWWFGFLESPYERDCYLGVPRKESQTTKRPKPPINHSQVKIACVGDSITAGFPFDSSRGNAPEVSGYPWHLQHMSESYEVVNFGKGETTVIPGRGGGRRLGGWAPRTCN